MTHYVCGKHCNLLGVIVTVFHFYKDLTTDSPSQQIDLSLHIIIVWNLWKNAVYRSHSTSNSRMIPDIYRYDRDPVVFRITAQWPSLSSSSFRILPPKNPLSPLAPPFGSQLLLSLSISHSSLQHFLHPPWRREAVVALRQRWHQDERQNVAEQQQPTARENTYRSELTL